jgi:hypothetical protein
MSIHGNLFGMSLSGADDPQNSERGSSFGVDGMRRPLTPRRSSAPQEGET